MTSHITCSLTRYTDDIVTTETYTVQVIYLFASNFRNCTVYYPDQKITKKNEPKSHTNQKVNLAVDCLDT